MSDSRTVGLANFPLLFPNAGDINLSYYIHSALTEGRPLSPLVSTRAVTSPRLFFGFPWDGQPLASTHAVDSNPRCVSPGLSAKVEVPAYNRSMFVAAQDGLTAAAVKAQAAGLGFDLCGIAPAESFPELLFIREWLDRGYAGEMHYMSRTAERRADVRGVMPGAKSVISLGVVYNTPRPYSIENADPSRAALARYAWGDDYHLVIERRLEELVAKLRATAGAAFEARAYVDTGPVQERVYAQYAGLGWIGKNTCLINPELGSWIFLAAIICNLAIEPDAPGLDLCGTCTLCLEACPTGALVEPHVLDATRCLSYLTIELKGSIPADRRDAVSEHAYGCDICQEVCPWNLSPSTGVTSQPEWQPRAGLDGPRLLDLWRRSDDDLRALLKGSAMKRAGVTRLRRNLAVAIGNSGDTDAADPLLNHAEPSCLTPLVTEHVAWAVEKLRRGRDAGSGKPDSRSGMAHD